MSWSDQQVVRLKEMLREGLSGEQMAKKLNAQFGTAYSREAVIGKSNRLGVVKPSATRPSAPAMVAAAITKPTPLTDVHQARVSVAAVQAAPLPKGGPSDGIATNPLPLLHPDFDVRRACRWPLVTPAADGELLYCCNRRPFGETYCEEHLRWKDPKHRSPDQIRAEAEHKARMTASAARGRTYTSRIDRKMAS